MSNKHPDTSLADLLRPLSAKVMPRSAAFDGGSRPKSPAQARMAQRGTTRQGPKSGKRPVEQIKKAE